MLLSVFLLQRDLKKMKKSDIVLFLGLWSARVRFGAAVSARAHREAEGIETVVLTNLSKRSLQAGGGTDGPTTLFVTTPAAAPGTFPTQQLFRTLLLLNQVNHHLL